MSPGGLGFLAGIVVVVIIWGLFFLGIYISKLIKMITAKLDKYKIYD